MSNEDPRCIRFQKNRNIVIKTASGKTLVTLRLRHQKRTSIAAKTGEHYAFWVEFEPENEVFMTEAHLT